MSRKQRQGRGCPHTPYPYAGEAGSHTANYRANPIIRISP